MNSRKFLLQAFKPVRFGFFTRPSTIVPLLHRRMAGIFKPFTPLSSFSHVTWSSETFISNYSVSLTCENFSTFHCITAWQFGFFTDPSTIVPSLHRLNVCIFTLFKLASFLYATISSTTFLASYSEPWIHGVSITSIQACTIWFFTRPSTIVPLLHRRMAGIFKPFTPLSSLSYGIWPAPSPLALNLRKFQYTDSLYYVTACRIRIIHSSVNDCTFIAPTET